jgi:hypothetical protein
MRPTTAVLGLAVLLAAASAAAAEPAREYKVDQVIPLPEDGVANVTVEVGPMVITQIALGTRPTAEDIAKDTRHTDTFRPKPRVAAHNAGTYNVEMFVEVALVDDAGKEYVDCRRSVGYDVGNSDETTLCRMDAMSVSDWPKVTGFRLVAHARPAR